MTVPAILINSLALIGLISFTYCFQWLVNVIVHYARYKELPSSVEEEKIKLLKSEIDSLRENISALEEENNEMTKAVLKRLQ